MTTTPIPSENGSTSIYNRVFWHAFAANLTLVMANALTFRFAELIAHLGGTEQVAGSIVSVGVFGALFARMFLGQVLDRYGTKSVWLLSCGFFVSGCVAFWLCSSIAWPIYAARIAYAVGVAGMSTASIVHIQNLVPLSRRTEVIGSLGSSGFIGMVVGAHASDLIFTRLPAGQGQFLMLFGSAATLGIIYLVLVVRLTRGTAHRRPRETPALYRLIFRYWPGTIVLVAIMMGIGLAVTTVFLTRFATERNLNGIGTFFTGYAVSAFVIRIGTRHWGGTVGCRMMVQLGLAGHCLGHCLFPFVTAEWHLLVPSVACGFGHALLFPAVVSVGAGRFPREYHGTGTTVVLGFTEIGVVISAPVLGTIIDEYGFSAMFYTSAATAFVIAILYSVASVRNPEVTRQVGESDGDEMQVATPDRGEPVSVPVEQAGL